MTDEVDKDSDWVAFNSVLSKKTSEQLMKWIDYYEREIISRSAIISVVSALYDATSGLVDSDLSKLIADIHQDIVKDASADT
jgi:hypothetical protein